MGRAYKFTMDMVMDAVEADDHIGFCYACGCEHYGIEPDARNYECEECGMLEVYGASELLLMGII
jgi:hypothetical protein